MMKNFIKSYSNHENNTIEDIILLSEIRIMKNTGKKKKNPLSSIIRNPYPL